MEKKFIIKYFQSFFQKDWDSEWEGTPGDATFIKQKSEFDLCPEQDWAPGPFSPQVFHTSGRDLRHSSETQCQFNPIAQILWL